ncbi:MAG TPA: hypothetical protein VMV10_24355 [Pirellulales bacterium]|nr:hypothetical protein [Pirellulales bacterium]
MVGALEPVMRAKLIMALLALVLLGLGLVVLIVMGGRFARRVARTPLPPSRMHEDRWYAKPLNAPESDQANPDGDEPSERADSDEPPDPGDGTGPERPDA